MPDALTTGLRKLRAFRDGTGRYGWEPGPDGGYGTFLNEPLADRAVAFPLLIEICGLNVYEAHAVIDEAQKAAEMVRLGYDFGEDDDASG